MDCSTTDGCPLNDDRYPRLLIIPLLRILAYTGARGRSAVCLLSRLLCPSWTRWNDGADCKTYANVDAGPGGQLSVLHAAEPSSAVLREDLDGTVSRGG